MTERTFTAEGARMAAAAETGGAPVFARLSGCLALEATGADAVEFLHGQLANDVKGLRDGATTRSLLLNHKGHAMAEAQVARLGPRRLVMVVDDEKGAWVQDTLARHVVFDEVELTPVLGAVITVQGVRAPEAVSSLGVAAPEGGEVAQLGESGHVYPTRRSGAGGYDVLLLGDGAKERAAEIERVLAGGGAARVDGAAIDSARVLALVPAAGRDGGEGVLPQEAGLEGLVSFRKGCYLGQEIMARIEARGSVMRRALTALELSSEPAGPDVTLEGRVVGRLGTVAMLPDGRLAALSVLRKDAHDADGLSVGEGTSAKRLQAARMMPA